jgi:PAS domain S-box-containing protein
MADRKKLPIQTSEEDSLNGLLLESLMTHSTDAIVITDSNDKIFHWNRAAESLFGIPAEEAFGKSIALILPLQMVSKLRNADNDISNVEVAALDGTPLPLYVKFGEAVDSEKTLVAFTYVFHDLRERVRQEESIKQKIRALEAFSYSVSHDLRAPLRRIINYADILEEDHLPALNEEVQRIISRMSKNAQKMSDLIEDLLTFSRVGQQTLEKITINLEALTKNVVDEQQNSPEGARVNFVIQKLPACEGDPTLLKQVIENLVTNAIKYSARTESPSVEIGCISGKDENTYFVKDNGIGFDMQYSQKLFNVFQRLHNPSDFEGTGIGLAIVQQIISRHGGTVRAEAKVNEGATFYFSLPK